MTIDSMVELFQLVQDHYNSPYFPDEQIVSFLNYGQKEIFNDLVLKGDSQAMPNAIEGVRYVGKHELDPAKIAILGDCFLIDQSVTAVGGIITFSAIEAVTTRTPVLITGLLDPSDAKIDILRQGEYHEFKENYFTKNDKTYARIGNGGIMPDGATTETFKVSCIVEPEDMDLSTPVQPTLRGVHEAIVIAGLNLAGYAVDEELLIQLKK